MSFSGATIKPEWLEPSDAYGWSAVSRNGLPLLALLWIAPWLAGKNAFAPWLLSPAIGLFLYRLTVVMHDCTHHTLFKDRRLNRRMGLLLGAVSGVDFNSFCRQHWRHHQSYGRAGDPRGFQYNRLSDMTSREWLRHLAKPLLGLNLRHVVAESLLAPSNVARLFRTGEFVTVALVQLVILALVTGAGRYPILAALPLLSSATFGLFFSQLRGIAEHGVVARANTSVVRSHEGSWPDRILLYDINFNYHAEHHMHPQVPSCHLPALHEATGASHPPGSMFDTLRALHAGEEPPHV